MAAAAILDLLGGATGQPTKAYSCCILSIKFCRDWLSSFQVIRIWIFCRSGLNVLFTPPKFQFWGFTPKFYGNIVQIPKRHTLAWFHVFWAVARKNPSTGVTCTQTWEKVKIEIYFCYISPIFPEALSGWICTKFGIEGHLVDVINCAGFFLDQFRGIDFVGVEICLFP